MQRVNSRCFQRHSNRRFGFPQPDDESPVPIRIIREAPLLDWLMHALNRHGETFGTDVNATVHCFLSQYGSLAHERPPALRFGLGSVPVRSHGLALVADLEHAGFMPPILHGVIREGRWPFSPTGSGSLPAKLEYGLSDEAQLHTYALFRNIPSGSRSTSIC